MSRMTIHQLYAEHTGKVSDKWSLYLTEYDRLFHSYRDKPLHLLEIGIQNGGSLEIWSKYFSNASALIGCDINPDCARLAYDDQRIGVIVGDANSPEIRERVFRLSPHFDIIIDDGSHLSKDIIKSFALYFPLLVEGGLFVAEDLHCSYWESYEGGLFNPYSSISFFKRLADVINYEHWGISKTRADVLRGIFMKYGCEVGPEALSQLHSVEFINSMCVVRKALAADNSLGRRVIAGSIEPVLPGLRELDSSYADQSSNPWSARTTPPDEAIQHEELLLANAQQEIAGLNQEIAGLNQEISGRSQEIAELNQEITGNRQEIIGLNQEIARLNQEITGLRKEIAELRQEITGLNQEITELNQEITGLNQEITGLNQEITGLNQEITGLNQEITGLRQEITGLLNSISWRITAPLRRAKAFLNSLYGSSISAISRLYSVIRRK
jgi:peptidoglycan hydrolase CwlO-like protein/cephalosporin hydroxylase